MDQPWRTATGRGAWGIFATTVDPTMVASTDTKAPAWMADDGRQSWQKAEVFAHVQDVIRHWADAPAADRPTAFICRDDQTAKMVISVMHGAGFHVPQALSLVGMGDVPDSAYLAPPRPPSISRPPRGPRWRSGPC